MFPLRFKKCLVEPASLLSPIPYAVMLLGLFAALPVTHAPVEAGEQKTITIEHSDPLLPSSELQRRWRDILSMNYDVSDETFRIFVPDSYSADVPHGILVWVSPADHGNIPDQYLDLFEQRRILAISAKNSGNERNIHERIMMAVDGARYLKRKYTVDEDRIYISGLSGGGRTASVVALIYPDLFTGGAYMNGANFYRTVPTGDKGVWSGFYPNAPKQFLQRVRQNRHAYITAADDFNKKQQKKFSKTAKQDGWQHVTYIEQPDHGHDPVGKKWYNNALKSLDEPLRKRAEMLWTSKIQGKNSSKSNPLKQWQRLQKIWLHGFDADFATKARNAMEQMQSRASQVAAKKLNKTSGNQNSFSSGRSREKKLRRFYRQWKGLPERKQVRAKLKNIARKKFNQLTQQQNASPDNIRSFYKRWVKLDLLTEKILSFYEHRASQASSQFGDSEPNPGQLGKLKQFRKHWAGTKTAEQAHQRMNTILDEIVNRLRNKPKTPETTRALMDIAVHFPTTEAAGDAVKILKDRGKMKAFKRRMKAVQRRK